MKIYNTASLRSGVFNSDILSDRALDLIRRLERSFPAPYNYTSFRPQPPSAPPLTNPTYSTLAFLQNIDISIPQAIELKIVLNKNNSMYSIDKIQFVKTKGNSSSPTFIIGTHPGGSDIVSNGIVPVDLMTFFNINIIKNSKLYQPNILYLTIKPNNCPVQNFGDIYIHGFEF
jgi:hypothetical protein